MSQRESVGTLPGDFWTRPAVAAALATCDMAALVEAVRLARGWSQTDLARTVGYSQSWVSRVVNGQQSLTLDQVREVCERLGIPIHLLRFAPAQPSSVPLTASRPPAAFAAGRMKGAGPTRRRDFTKAVALATLSLPNLSAVGNVHEETAATLRAITGSQRRLDASSPSRDLVNAALAHWELSARTLSRAKRTPFAAEVAAASSEAAGFAAWLHADMGDSGSARSFYHRAVKHAHQAGDVLLTVYMLGSLALFEIDSEEPELGLRLAEEAAHKLRGEVHPTAQAWLSCVCALGHAALGNRAATQERLAHAEHAAERSENTDPPWPWVFRFDSAKVAGYRALAAVRLRRPHEARAAFFEAFPRTVSAPKQQSILMVELATAHADAGDVDEAFRLASHALQTGVAYRSEKVLNRVRRFRREYRGPQARCVHAFDEQLASLTTGRLPL